MSSCLIHELVGKDCNHHRTSRKIKKEVKKVKESLEFYFGAYNTQTLTLTRHGKSNIYSVVVGDRTNLSELSKYEV